MEKNRPTQRLDHYDPPTNFRGRSGLVVFIWWFVQGTLFALSPQFMYGWRAWLLRVFGAEIGKDVRIRSSAKITYPWKLRIGDHSWIGDDSVIYCVTNITIGKQTVISQKCYLAPGGHEIDRIAFDVYLEPIVIGDGVWVSTDVFVGSGVHIGDGCVIGARSSVFEHMPAWKICYGYPAKAMKDRPELK